MEMQKEVKRGRPSIPKSVNRGLLKAWSKAPRTVNTGCYSLNLISSDDGPEDVGHVRARKESHVLSLCLSRIRLPFSPATRPTN
jgi:hypothetical protein